MKAILGIDVGRESYRSHFHEGVVKAIRREQRYFLQRMHRPLEISDEQRRLNGRIMLPEFHAEGVHEWEEDYSWSAIVYRGGATLAIGSSRDGQYRLKLLVSGDRDRIIWSPLWKGYQAIGFHPRNSTLGALLARTTRTVWMESHSPSAPPWEDRPGQEYPNPVVRRYDKMRAPWETPKEPENTLQ